MTAQTQPYPWMSITELAAKYRAYVERADLISLDLSQWLPAFHKHTRPLVPGELCFIMADTGVGKSMALQNIVMATREPSLFFELELPDTLLFERFMAATHRLPCSDVEETYRRGTYLELTKLAHVHVCDQTRLSKDGMKRMIDQARQREPSAVMVFVDYIGLMNGAGKSRYERVSSSAEDLKVLAKETGTVIVAATQRSRPGSEQYDHEVDLHDAKDSGSIENSADLFLGMWRCPNDTTGQTLWVKILKNRKGRAGGMIPCNIDGARMLITEQAREEPEMEDWTR